MLRAAKELGDDEISEALQAKLTQAQTQRPRLALQALARLERATAQVVKEENALETASANVDEAQDMLHQAKTAAREARLQVQQVRTQHAGGLEDGDTKQVGDDLSKLVSMSAQAEKMATDDQTKKRLADDKGRDACLKELIANRVPRV